MSEKPMIRAELSMPTWPAPRLDDLFNPSMTTVRVER